ncbi:MAG: hypothetical protein AAGU75_02965 [Bacillota bacterium]
MSRLVSPLNDRVAEINVKEGEVIRKNDKMAVIESENTDDGILEQHYELEEYPQYQMLYGYFTSSHFTAV